MEKVSGSNVQGMSVIIAVSDAGPGANSKNSWSHDEHDEHTVDCEKAFSCKKALGFSFSLKTSFRNIA